MHVNIMIDKGLDRSAVQKFDTSKKALKGHFFGFRKMFWDYLQKLNVVFYDACCEDAAVSLTRKPLSFNESGKFVEYFNGTEWVSAEGGLQKPASSTAVNVTATVTAAELAVGRLTSTSAAAVSITLPTATQLATELSATAGSRFQFTVDNSAGSNTVTVIVGSGITVNTPAITGGATLTVSTANAVAIFELYFISTTAAKILRIA